jgi:hypothetical protein
MVTGMELDFSWGYLGRWGFNIRLAIMIYNGNHLKWDKY